MSKKRGNNEGTIVKLPSGSWRGQITLDGRRLGRTFPTRRGCQEWIREIRNQIEDGLTYASTKVSLGEFMKDWLITIKASRQHSTWVGYESVCRNHIIPNLGQIKIRELQTANIQGLYNTLVEQRVGPHTIIKIHTVLHSALQQANKTGMIFRNPASYAQPPKEPVKEMAILDESQISQLLVSADGHRWKGLYHLAIVSGMRQMELLGLKWIDLDWVRQAIKVERQLLRPVGSVIEFSAPKTKYGKRTIELGDKSIDVLRAHFEYQQTERLAADARWAENGLIFTNTLGGPIHPRNLLRNFKSLLKSAGLPPIRFHDLRHTAASLMLNNGIPLIVVSRRLGHARASITLDVYGHLIPTMQSQAARLIDELVMPIPVDMENSTINS